MPIRPHLIVTGRKADGTSVFVTDEPADPIEVDAMPGSEIYLLWGTEDGAPTVGTGLRQPKHLPYFPGTGGTRILCHRFAPDSSASEPVGDPAAQAAEVAEKLPACSTCSSRTTPACTPPIRWTTASAWKARCTWSWTTARRSG